MTIKYVIIGIIIATSLVPGTVFASLNQPRDPFTQDEKDSGLYTEEGYLLDKSNRPAINPDLDVDEDCKFDSYQIKCQPGSEQECPWGPGTNEDDSCVPRDVECPDGYNITDDDESGQCIPNERCEGYDDMVLIEREGKSDRCAAFYYICDNEEFRNEDFCIEWCEREENTIWCKPDAS